MILEAVNCLAHKVWLNVHRLPDKCLSFTCFFPSQYFFMLSVTTLSLCWMAGPLMATLISVSIMSSDSGRLLHTLGVAIRGESRTRHCTWGRLDPPTPSPKGPSSEILPAGIGAIIRTLHNCDRCFFYGPDPALTGLYPERGEGGGGNWWLTISNSEEAGRYDFISAYRRARKLKLGSKWGRI